MFLMQPLCFRTQSCLSPCPRLVLALALPSPSPCPRLVLALILFPPRPVSSCLSSPRPVPALLDPCPAPSQDPARTTAGGVAGPVTKRLNVTQEQPRGAQHYPQPPGEGPPVQSANGTATRMLKPRLQNSPRSQPSKSRTTT